MINKCRTEARQNKPVFHKCTSHSKPDAKLPVVQTEPRISKSRQGNPSKGVFVLDCNEASTTMLEKLQNKDIKASFPMKSFPVAQVLYLLIITKNTFNSVEYRDLGNFALCLQHSTATESERIPGQSRQYVFKKCPQIL